MFSKGIGEKNRTADYFSKRAFISALDVTNFSNRMDLNNDLCTERFIAYRVQNGMYVCKFRYEMQ